MSTEYYAQSYDSLVDDWPGEIDFYEGLVRDTGGPTARVLEVACGTGRVAIQLARRGISVVGIDRSSSMLDIARSKSRDLSNIQWHEADMRSFSLDSQFEVVVIPGHSFQNLLTPADQVACLERVGEHLGPESVFCLHLDHQDVDWLGQMIDQEAGLIEGPSIRTDPASGGRIRTTQTWWYRRSSQTAELQTQWEELGADDAVLKRESTERIPIHAVFPFEAEHLLIRAGFEILDVYGDFFRDPFTDVSSEMIWLARRSP